MAIEIYSMRYQREIHITILILGKYITRLVFEKHLNNLRLRVAPPGALHGMSFRLKTFLKKGLKE